MEEIKICLLKMVGRSNGFIAPGNGKFEMSTLGNVRRDH